MIQDGFTAAINYVRALGYIGRKGFKRYFFFSGLIGLGLLAIGILVISGFYDTLSTFIATLIPWDISWLGPLASIVSVAGMGVFFLVIFKHLMLILTAPLMSALSAKVEEDLDPERYDHDSQGTLNFLKEMARGIRIASRNIIRELFYTLVLFILGLIPGLAIVTSPAILAVQGYYAGFGNFDFWAERHFSFRSTVDFMKDHRAMTTVNGVVFLVILAVPVIGVFLAPPLATIAATIQGMDKLDELDV